MGKAAPAHGRRRRLGLRRGASVEITVEPSGRDTDQWRVLAVD